MTDDLSLTFLGAARNVTGSRTLLEAGGVRLLVDCGMYQERDLRSRNWDPFPVPPESIQALLLTHAHVDHCGLLPKLVREGFRGPVYCTEATAEIARIVLADSAHLHEEDAETKRRRHQREGRQGPYPEVPLYTRADAEAVFPLLRGVRYRQPVSLDGVEAVFRNAGHILGSASIQVKAAGRTVIFSGDVGRPDAPILRDPVNFDHADYVQVESTYGDRLHEDVADPEIMLAEVIQAAVKQRGNVVIPSFAIERAQDLLYRLNRLRLDGRIPPLPVFLDSPMAGAVTKVFRNHPELFDAEMAEFVANGDSPFEQPGLKVVQDVDESKAVSRFKGPAVIIAGSGMCTGGRIKHHLESNVGRRESTVLFVGYQAAGTLGRHLVDGAREMRLFGKRHRIRAKVAQVHGFSGHADRDELTAWLSSLKTAPRRAFVTHGEAESCGRFARHIRETLGWEAYAPEFGETVKL
ncbi:MAG: MBL fold metallo-hydrolase [Candidatus Zixiibacteriota bacterium]|nr:MAG: MBL fold metallo-hydrolase [candidate division Zixibacteria bacterium]